MIGLQFVESDAAFVRAVGVAVVTELDKNWLNLLSKLRRAGSLRGTRGQDEILSATKAAMPKRARIATAASPCFCSIGRWCLRFMSRD